MPWFAERFSQLMGLLLGVLILVGRTQGQLPIATSELSDQPAGQSQTAPAPSGPPAPAGTLPGSGSPCNPDGSLAAPLGPVREGPAVFGVFGLRGFFTGDHVASNGVEFHQLFSLDLDFNLWLWRQQGLYYFLETRFWGQKPAPGITNSSQGAFDFSKREFDLTTGVAWNYFGSWEARVFAYSYNNLNRGDSSIAPTGFNDGVGLENRYYINPVYQLLGTSDFDKARASFVSVGFYPTKDMVDGDGLQFKPGPFARCYLTLELLGPMCYLFTDTQLIATRSFTPKMLTTDSGIAVRPFQQAPRLEFRLGTEDSFDLQGNDLETGGYLSVRYVY